MRSPYSLLARVTKKRKTIYYVRFWLEQERTYATPKSTGQTSKAAAKAWAEEYLSRGVIATRERVNFAGFAKDFYAEDGDYVRAQRLRGKQFGIAHLRNQQTKLDKYAIPYFGDQLLRNLRVEDLEGFRDRLLGVGLAASTIRQTLLSVTTVLRWAVRRRLMQQVPVVENVIGRAKERGILTPEEVRRLFALPDWPAHHRLINLIAYTTGMRMGEILALTHGAIHLHEGYLDVEASWDRITKALKSTKTRRCRVVPLAAMVRGLLEEHLRGCQSTEPDDLIFAGRFRSQPLDHKIVERVLYEMLAKIGIDSTVRQERNLCFHSARHFFNSLMINSGVPGLKVKALTGHSTDRMTEHYYHADDMQDVVRVSEGVFA